MEPKAFQRAAIDAAVRALKTGSRRFLLADEVGLGKTVVAKETIWALAGEKPEGEIFRVFYVCSSQPLAKQNAPRLIRDEAEDEYELLDISRPSLLPNGNYSSATAARIQIFRFSPETALPIVKKKPRGGMIAERALLFILRRKVLRWRFPRTLGLKEVFRGRAGKKTFFGEVRAAGIRYRRGTLLRGHNFSGSFYSATRMVLGLKPGDSLQARLDGLARSDPNDLLGKLRTALTLASLECMPPDLVIFDEFHRYQDKAFALPGELSINPGTIYSTFLHLLPKEMVPRLLLLSATPFKFTHTATGRSSSRADAVLFHKLVGFLHGDGSEGLDAYRACSKAFGVFEAELAAERFDSTELHKVKARLENKILRPRMARMERAAFTKAAGEDSELTPPDQFPTERDISLLAGFARGLRERDKAAAVTFWRSIPLPHQAMGPSYVMWKKAPPDKKKRWRKLPGVSVKGRSSMRLPEEAYHPKLRELLKLFPPERLALPWLAPSSPWWTLQGPWARSEPLGEAQKGLLFSHYRAVPTAVAGLVSLSLEEWASRRMGWKSSRKLAKSTFLPAKTISNILLFHPSVWLASSVDPTAHRFDDRKQAIRSVAKELRTKLPTSVPYDASKKTNRPIWKVLALIEHHDPATPALFAVWKKVRDSKGRNDQLMSGLGRIASEGNVAEPYVSAAELRSLAWFALTAPGVVLLRSVARQSKGLYGNLNGLSAVADLAWRGLRSYLDQPWFVARLSRTSATAYPADLQMAVYEGNLEASLDEHFWLGDPDNPNWFRDRKRPGRLEALRQGLSIRAAPVVFQLPGAEKKQQLRLAAHVALPLTDSATEVSTEIGDEKLRADDLRRAFNTPFWPHLLCTTSVGQEGLDFHQWCQTVVHWDLPGGPIEFEQREGRVDRFRSLAVRRAIMNSPGGQVADRILWDDLGQSAEALGDASGLRPWWVMDGAKIRRAFLDAPSSDERMRKKELARLRDLYRLVLGMPNQWQLLARLAASDLDVETARRACLNLAAWMKPIVTSARAP